MEVQFNIRSIKSHYVVVIHERLQDVDLRFILMNFAYD